MPKYIPKYNAISDVAFLYKQVLQKIVGDDISIIPSNAVSKANYPYITIDIPTLHETEAQGATRRHEIFKTTLMLNVYADNQQDAMNISNDIQTYITMSPYIDQLHDSNIGIASIADGGTANLSAFGAENVYQATIRQQLRLTNDIPYGGPFINDIKQGGEDINGSHYNS